MSLKNVVIGGIVLLMAGVVGLILSGCARRAPDDRIRLVFTVWGTPEQVEVEREVIAAFEAQYPEIDIRLKHIPARYNEKLMTMMAGGMPPDVMMIELTVYPSFVQRGVFLNLESKIYRDNLDFSDIFPLALDAWRFQGDLYALPRDISGWVIYYNKDLFDKAGLPRPHGDWTWQDFRDAARKLTKDITGDGRIDQFGATAPPFELLIWAYGGAFFDCARHPQKSTITSPEAIAGIRFVEELFKEGIVASLGAMLDEGGHQMFMTGRVAMHINGRWMTPEFKRIRDFSWDVAPVPLGKDGQRVTSHGGTAYVISSATRHPEEAWKFIQFYTSPEAVRIAMRGGRTTPIHKSIAHSPEFLDMRPPENMKAFVETMEIGRRDWYIPQNMEVVDILHRHFELVMLGLKGAEEAAYAIERELDRLLFQE